MSRLNVDLVQEKKWKLEHLEIKDEAEAIEAVRRRGNAYALNAQNALIALSMTNTDIDSLILGKECQELEHLYLGYNEKLTRIEFDLECTLPKLQYLYLNNCALNSTLRLPEGLANLKQIYVQKNQLQGLVFEGDCPELELLDGSGNQLEQFVSPEGFGKLSYCYFRDNQIADIKIPKPLNELIILDLQNNQLQELPLILIQSLKLKSLYLHDNPLERFKKDVLNDEGDKNSWDGILNYLTSLVKDDVREYDQVKLIVLGNSTAGKTSLVHFLKDRQYIKGRYSTLGMVPIIWELDATCRVAVWDFGGQEYFHNIHHLFFTDQCLYLVVFEKKTNTNGTLPTEIKIYGNENPIIEDLEHFHYDYWVDNIRYLTQNKDNKNEGEPALDVFLVQNKLEIPPVQKIKDADFCISVEKAAEALQSGNTEEDDYWFDFRSFEIKLKQKLHRIRGQVPVSSKWLDIKNEIQSRALAGVPFLSKQAYTQLAEGIKPGISQKAQGEKPSELDTLIDTFTKSGVVLYYPKIDENRIFINPVWLTDVIYRILDFEVKENGGEFSLNDPKEAVATWKEQKSLSADAILSPDEIIDLMKSLDLIFELNPDLNQEECKNGERIFIAPQYLPLEAPEPKSVKRKKDSILNQHSGPYFSLYYPTFLPKSTMPRFIARNGHLANLDYWRHGIIYYKDGMEVLVECLFDQRIIHFWIKPSEINAQLIRETFVAFHEINKENLEVQISLNQKNFIQIGDLLTHPFGENSKIKAVDGTLLDAEDFVLFVGDAERKKFVDFKTNIMGIEKEIEGLTNALNLLIEKKNQFEEDRAIASDSEKKFELRKKLEKLEQEINEYREKIHQLSGHSQEVEQKPIFINKIEELIVKTDNLSSQVGEMHNQIKLSFKEVLSRLSTQDQQLINILQVSEASKAELAQSFLDLNEQVLDEEKMKDFVQEINNMVAEHILELPDTLQQQWKTLNSKAADYTDAKAKFKLKIPIIPAILEYETELNWDIRKLAKEVWTDFKAGNIFLKKKD